MQFSNSPQTTFIPKKPMASSNVRPRVRGGVNFFLIVGVIMFILSIASAGLTFAWRKNMERQIAQSEAYIKKNEASFEADLLDTISKLNERIEVGKELLSKHVAVSKIFDVIGSETIESVRFKSLNYSLDDKGEVKIALSGEGDNFNSIAIQSDHLNKSKNLKNPIMSNFTVSESGKVGFNLTANVPVKLILYK